MNLTRKRLRRLIQEALDRIPILKPVTRQELDQIRAQSRSRAGIGTEFKDKLQGLESTGQPEFINQARGLAKTLGSDQGEISATEEDNFFRAQTMHEMIAIFEPIFGQAVYSIGPKLLKKIYKSTKFPSGYEVWIYDMVTGQEQPDEEPKDVVLEKLKKGDYVIYSFGTVRYAKEDNITNQDFTNLQNGLKRNLPLPPDYYIFKMLTKLRPDLDVWSAN